MRRSGSSSRPCRDRNPEYVVIAIEKDTQAETSTPSNDGCINNSIEGSDIISEIPEHNPRLADRGIGSLTTRSQAEASTPTSPRRVNVGWSRVI